MAAAEQKKSYQIVKQFKGLNTKANRTAIDESEFSWLENAMPVGYANMRIVPTASNVGSVTFANTAVYLTSGNIGLNDYLLSFQADGRCEYVDLSTNAKGNVAVAGTFSSSGLRVSQWRNERILIADPSKGYYTWDGISLVFVGSVGAIGIRDGGSAYTTPPLVTISAPNDANGVQATAACTVAAGAGELAYITITTIGNNYTSIPSVTIGAPNLSNGVTATAAATIQSGNVVAIGLITPGSGYTTAPSVTITGGGGANAAANSTILTGAVNYIYVNNAGTGYTSAPTVTFSGGGGANANAVAGIITFATGIVAVQITNGGTGYSNSANLTVTIAGGGGTNAACSGIVSGGQVTQAIMTNPGINYSNSANITVTIAGGGGTGATAKGIITTDTNVGIQSFSGRVWIAQGRTVYYSAAGSYSDFTSISAGGIVLTDSTLHGNIVQLLSANNFLYVFGDDSINVFSDVRVSTTGITIFTNTNVSASIGTRLPYAIFPYFRSVIFMNDYGVYALVGSTTTKISDALDGIFTTVDFAASQVTSGQCLINNILCASFNFKYTGGSGTSASDRFIQAVFFEKKWFFTSQGALSLVASIPTGGKVNIYGTDGNSCVHLYNDKTAAVSSYIQTALLPMGDNIRTKQALKIGIEATSSGGITLEATVDSEINSSPAYTLVSTVFWYNYAAPNTPVLWTNNVATVIDWIVGGYNLYKTDAQQYGKYLGITVTSNDPAFYVNGFEFEHELRVRF